MEKVKDGLFVQVDYTGTLHNGEVFDTSDGREPLEVQMGAGQLIQGFESALMGMVVDEEKKFTLSPEEAYGQHDQSLVRDFPRADVPADLNPKEGQTVALTSTDGRQIPARITKVDDKSITVDLNHPLAGESLTFDIKVVGISSEATQKPQACGPGCDCSSGCC
ncbi:MAG: peptidylprolyl isomerase [Desulfobacteraceae bacterium]|jgi:peptidylprolyl isomerase